MSLRRTKQILFILVPDPIVPRLWVRVHTQQKIDLFPFIFLDFERKLV